MWLIENPDGEFRKTRIPVAARGASQVRFYISAGGENPLDWGCVKTIYQSIEQLRWMQSTS